MVSISAVILLTAAALVVGVSGGDSPPKYCGKDLLNAVLEVCSVSTPETKTNVTPKDIWEGGIMDTCCRTGCTDEEIRASGICNLNSLVDKL